MMTLAINPEVRLSHFDNARFTDTGLSLFVKSAFLEQFSNIKGLKRGAV